MNFKVKNVKQGYCEVWSNERPGGRYRKVAEVIRLDSLGVWYWDSWEIWGRSDAWFFKTRGEAVRNAKRTALEWAFEDAIRTQVKPSEHWHSPRRDAVEDIRNSGCFSPEEVDMYRRWAEDYERV